MLGISRSPQFGFLSRESSSTWGGSCQTRKLFMSASHYTGHNENHPYDFCSHCRTQDQNGYTQLFIYLSSMSFCTVNSRYNQCRAWCVLPSLSVTTSTQKTDEYQSLSLKQRFGETHRWERRWLGWWNGEDWEKDSDMKTKISHASGSNNLSKQECDRDPVLVSMFTFPHALSVNWIG